MIATKTSVWSIKKISNKMGVSPRTATRFIHDLGYIFDYLITEDSNGQKAAVLLEGDARAVIDQWKSQSRSKRSDEYAKKETSRLRKELSEVKRERDRLNFELETIQKAPTESPKWLEVPEEKDKHHATMVLMLSDLHLGELVSRKQVYGYNEFNVKIAERRIKQVGDNTIKVVREYFGGSSKLKIDGAVIVMAGDLVSGDIHSELSITNEMTPSEAIAHFAPIVSEEIVGKFYTEFGNVHGISVPGNHDRSYQKVHAKNTATSAASWTFSKWIESMFSGISEVTFDISEAADAYYKVYSTRLAVTHGDCFKASDSVIGALGPAKRGTLKKSFRNAQMGIPFDVLLMGHFHTYCSCPSQAFVINGALKGYDEYASRCGFAPEPPMQALLMLTPERGITFSAPIFCNPHI